MDKTSPSDRVKKTRNRIPTSCDHCRKRKLKCDRQKPCSNCVKSQTEDMCKYAVSTKTNTNSSNSIPKINMNNEIIKLKLKINKLEKILEMNNIDISSYSNMLPGVLDDSNDDDDDDDSNIVDPMVSLSNKFDAMIIKENKILHSGTTSYVTFIVRDKQLANIFEAYAKRHIMIYESYQKKQKVKASDFPVDMSQNHLSWLTTNAATEVSACDLDNVESMQYGNFVSPPGSGITSLQAKLVLDVLKDVNSKLPPLFVVNVLVDHFFKYVYPLLPLIDEEIFRDELSYVLVPTENGGCKVAITHLQNTSIVSLLLVILRYAYLAVNIKDYAEDNRAIGNEFLIAMIKSGYKIESNFVVMSKSLLMALPAEDSIFKKVTLRNIQVLLYLRLYQVYSPEMHEESREHSLTLALIIQMCRSLGANRDPENFPHIFKDSREISVWRRIFYKLLTLDINNAFEYGCPLIISDDEYDIKLPSLNEEDTKILSDFKKGLSVSKSGDEIKKLVIENAINKDTALEFEAIKLIREGLSIFQNFKSSFKKSKLLKIVDQMQEFVDKRIPSLWEMLQDNSTANYLQLEKLFDIPKVRKFEIRLTMQTILMGFYYLLYLNEEDEHAGVAMNNSPDNIEEELDGDEGDSPEPFDFMTNKYGIRAMELALTVLKMNYDYAKYVTQSVTLDGDSKQYKALKYFSAKCDVFILNRIAMSFLRPFLFLCSTFLKNIHVQSTLTIDEVIKKFSNTIDSTVVLKWFNMNVVLVKDSSKLDCEFSFLLFQYVKDLFFMNYNLKNEYFICWRNTMIIKLFINYFKSTDKNMCTEYLHPSVAQGDEKDDLDTYKPMVPNQCDGFVDEDNNEQKRDGGYMDGVVDSNTSNSGISTVGSNSVNNAYGINPLVGLGESKVMQDFLDTAVPEDNLMNVENDGNNLDNLIYDDVDNMIDDIFRDSGVRQQMAREFELFNVNQFTGGIGQIIGTSSESTSEERSNFEAKLNNIVYSKPSVSSSVSGATGTSGSTSLGLEGSLSTGSGGPFTSMTNISDNSNMRTPDLSMFTDSPVDYTKGGTGDGTSLRDVIDELQDKGLFY
ncbi:hypothetical protein C6P40_003955 [Pichia californica]|uniref:Zn(2)-C6 fungal-type domain-containing protein n=1 Tax=Pichia californica TaxID=460514 RepID=A0A9P6WN53_9ASCO|nr:hypothetical protein C6P42_004663 [[Candida] californica]KAG0690059.1 hypothetical protein C6P40_003955 [[Candida] californica]